MKKNLVLVIAFLTIFLGLYAISHTSYAEDTGRPYTLLAPLPLEEGGGLTQQVTFTTYVNGAFRFVLGVAGILAVIMIIYAGFTYMTTDAFQKKEEGREIISNAVKGLLLAIGTWIILNTINPNLLKFDLIITKPQQVSPVTNLNIQSEQEARALLGQLQTKDPCPEGVTTNCVNLVGLPTETFTELNALQTACNCNIFISGGTEGGHQTHGINIPVVDLRNNNELVNYIKTTGTKMGTSNIGDVYKIGNNQFILESNHVHACIGTACRVEYN